MWFEMFHYCIKKWKIQQVFLNGFSTELPEKPKN